MNQLQIADQIFEITHSELSAYISRGDNGPYVSWSIELKCGKREIDELDWEPQISTHSFELDLSPKVLQSRTDIALPDSEDEEPAFMVYIFEHEPLQMASISANWLGNTLVLELSGLVNVYADEKYGAELPLKAHCELEFTGVTVDEYHFSNAQEKFSQLFDPLLFEEPARHTNGGVIFCPLPCSAA
jgi:hypothetical protein